MACHSGRGSVRGHDKFQADRQTDRQTGRQAVGEADLFLRFPTRRTLN